MTDHSTNGQVELNSPSRPVDLDQIVQLICDALEHTDSTYLDSGVDPSGDIQQMMRDSRIFTIWQPAELGGTETELHKCVEIVRSISSRHGSVGWITAVGITTGLLLGHLEREASANLVCDRSRLPAIFGSFSASGSAARVPGGYLLEGTWSPVSGVRLADEILLVARTVGTAFPATIAALLPRSAVTIKQTWNAFGLRQSGGHTVSVHSQFVPFDRVARRAEANSWPANPIFSMPFRTITAPVLAAVPLGLADAALQAAARLGTATSARSSDAYHRSGEIRALHSSAAAWLDYECNRYTEAIRTGRIPSHQEINLRLAATHAASVSTQVVGWAFEAIGARAVHADSEIARLLCDVRTACSHAAIAPAVYATAGAALKGQWRPEFRTTPGAPGES